MQNLQSTYIKVVSKTWMFSVLFYYYLICETRGQTVAPPFSTPALMRSYLFRPLLRASSWQVARAQLMWVFCPSFSSSLQERMGGLIIFFPRANRTEQSLCKDGNSFTIVFQMSGRVICWQKNLPKKHAVGSNPPELLCLWQKSQRP